MILLIQCFKAFNNALGWKDPDSREREGRNKVGRAQPQLHIKGQAENKKQNYYEKHLKHSHPQFFFKYLLWCHGNLKDLWFY